MAKKVEQSQTEETASSSETRLGIDEAQQLMRANDNLKGFGFDLFQWVKLLQDFGKYLPVVMQILEILKRELTSEGFRSMPPESRTPNQHAVGCCATVREHLLKALVECLKCEECCKPAETSQEVGASAQKK